MSSEQTEILQNAKVQLEHELLIKIATFEEKTGLAVISVDIQRAAHIGVPQRDRDQLIAVRTEVQL